MNRREVIRKAAQLGMAAGIGPLKAQGQYAGILAPAIPFDLPADLVGPTASDAYFGDEALFKSLGTRTLLQPSNVRVIAFNFPSWHPSPYMEQLFGKGWTEYETLRNARSLFPGHTMPHYPLWGYYDESDPVWAAREIDLAADHGVDAWMIDWYWHSGKQFYQEQLEEGFLKAPNRSRLKFAIMWANHDWKNVYPAHSPSDAATLLPQMHTLEDFETVTNYCAERYFSQENYLRVDGAPLFGIFDIGKLVQQLHEDGLKRALEIIRERSRILGFPTVHLQICNGTGSYEPKLKEFGFDSATLYGESGARHRRFHSLGLALSAGTIVHDTALPHPSRSIGVPTSLSVWFAPRDMSLRQRVTQSSSTSERGTSGPRIASYFLIPTGGIAIWKLFAEQHIRTTPEACTR
jgi:hypothetical protein